MEELTNDGGRRVLFEDECSFQQQAGKCRAWTPPEEKDPVYYLEPGRKSVKIYGVIDPANGRLTTMKTWITPGIIIPTLYQYGKISTMERSLSNSSHHHSTS